ncbi:MAG: DUF4386 domain-containing protein [Anaerolineae bacterium]
MNIKRQNTSINTSSTAAMQRQLAWAAGICFLITHVTSVGAAALYAPVLNNADYLMSSGADIQILCGALLEVILAITVIGTGVALFPVAKKQNEGGALGYMALRTLEAGIIIVGILPLLALVSLRQFALTSSTDPATMLAISKALVVFHNWTFILGPGLVCAANTTVMAYLLYRSRFVPRLIPTLGLIGAPLIFALNTAQLFGIFEQIPAWAAIAVLPIFTWEVSLAIWLIVKGFKAAALAPTAVTSAANEQLSAA